MLLNLNIPSHREHYERQLATQSPSIPELPIGTFEMLLPREMTSQLHNISTIIRTETLKHRTMQRVVNQHYRVVYIFTLVINATARVVTHNTELRILVTFEPRWAMSKRKATGLDL